MPEDVVMAGAGRQRDVGDLFFSFPPEYSQGGTRFGDWRRGSSVADVDWGFTSTPDRWHGPDLEWRSTDAWTAWLWRNAIELNRADAWETHVEALLEGEGGDPNFGTRFLLVVRESASGAWHVWTDPLGTLHVYHGDGPRGRALGSCYASVLEACSARELDWQGLTGFFGTGFFPDERTHVRDVSILRPGHHYRFDPEGLLLGRAPYTSWRHDPDTERSTPETLEGLHALLSEIVPEGLGGQRVAVPVSGGLDSRTLAGLLCAGDDSRSAPDCWAYSYGYGSDSIEVRIGASLAETCGFPFTRVPIEPCVFEGLESILAASDGLHDLVQARQFCAMDALRGRADVVVGGHWGDVWFDSFGLDANAPDDVLLEKAAALMLNRERGWLFEHLCAPHLASSPDALLQDGLREGLRRYADIADADFRLKAFKTDHWSFRWTLAGTRMFRLGARLHLPFYDPRFRAFMETVPSALLRDRFLQVEYLKRYHPALARIPWQARHADLFHLESGHARRRMARGVRKLGRRLTGTRVLERNWEVQLLGAGARESLTERLLSPGLKIHDLVARTEIERLLDDFFLNAWVGKGAYPVTMLLSFSEWLQRHG